MISVLSIDDIHTKDIQPSALIPHGLLAAMDEVSGVLPPSRLKGIGIHHRIYR
ncbi:hypothetical protein [Comamonas sp. C24C]